MATPETDNKSPEEKPKPKPKPKEKSQTTTGNTHKDVAMPSPQWYFAPGTGQLIYIANSKEAAKLKQDCDFFTSLIRDVRTSNQKVAQAVDAYQTSVGKQLDSPVNKEKALADIRAAEQALDIKTAALSEELKGISSASTKTMVELFPIYRGNKNSRFASYKSTFVRSDKMKNHWRTYDLTEEVDLGEMKSFLVRDASGKRIIDVNKLKRSVSELDTKLGAHVDIIDPVEGVLTDWAGKWNENLKTTLIGDDNKYVDCSAEAQVMRYTAGLSASAEWDPKGGSIGAKAEGKAVVAIAQGKASAALFIPSKMGLRIGFTGVKEKNYEMGRIRLQLKLELSSFVGASVMAEAGIEIQTKNKRQYVRGRPRSNSDFSSGQQKPRMVPKEVGGEVGAEAGAFAGASAKAQVNGSLEWLNPEHSDKGIAGFKTFANIGPALEAQAGAGLTASFKCSLRGGKIRVKIMLGACLGVGAKGKLELEVDVKTIAEFVVLVYYQLARAGYDTVKVFFLEEVLEYIRRLEAYILATGEALNAIYNTTVVYIQKEFEKFEKKYQKYSYRKNIASRIIARPESLKTTLPRAKGHLIWLLTRHDAKGDIPAAMWGEWELRGTGYKHCTKAIDVILTSIQSQKEWIEVFAGIRSDSDKNTGGHNPHRKALNEFYEHYAGRKSSDIENIRMRLPENMGWKTAWNDNPAAMQESQILLAKYEARDGTLPETLICFDETQNNGTMMA